MTMQIIKRTVLTSNQAAITFTDIPNTFTDLYCLVTIASTNGDDNLYFKFNNTTANTSWRNMLSWSSGTASQSGSGWLAAGGVRSPVGSTIFTNIGITIPNYAGNTAKAASVESTSEEAGNNAYSFLVANLWNDTAAINRIDFYLQGGQLLNGSSVTLYGVTNAAKTAKATGGQVTLSNGFAIHTFTASGTFTPTQDLSNVDYLVIAGGAGGGAGHGGGGGAGGYRTSAGTTGGGASAESKLNLTAGTSYTVTVGAGGAGGQSGSIRGTAGSNSVFNAVTSVGGGAGAGYVQLGGAGGSGGGSSGGAGAGGAATANQGFNGMAGSTDGFSWGAGGGGGGAGGLGTNGYGISTSNGVGGNGGAGLASTITGSSVTRAGGGAGGSNTAGTGGAGGGGNTGTAGAVNTGSGGGGAFDAGGAVGGAGGSGIVIVRYPI